MDAEGVVQSFCEAWSRMDVDEILGYFAEGAIYHNIPMPAAEGHEAIRRVLEMFVPLAQRIEFEILHMASIGNVVHTERVDRFEMGDKKVELPVAGIFEVRDGKITNWRDYFDLQTWMNQTS
jgi:limonene-1,2-epoxide hydrolase